MSRTPQEPEPTIDPDDIKNIAYNLVHARGLKVELKMDSGSGYGTSHSYKLTLTRTYDPMTPTEQVLLTATAALLAPATQPPLPLDALAERERQRIDEWNNAHNEPEETAQEARRRRADEEPITATPADFAALVDETCAEINDAPQEPVPA